MKNTLPQKFNLFFKAAALLFPALFLAFLPFINCQAQSGQEFKPTAAVGVIKQFNVSALLNSDSSLDITETIVYDFGNFNRHGIYRTIPVKYKIEQASQGEEISQNIEKTKTLGTKYNLRIKNISVADEKGNPYQFSTSKESRYLKIKIGDPDTFVKGTKTYVIKYQVWRALSFFSETDELYWNVTGTEWEEPILQASFEVILPQAVEKENLRQACYTGSLGSSQSFCLAEITAKNKVTFNLEQGSILRSREGLTAVLSWPKGIIQPVSKSQEYRWILEDNLGVLYAFIAPVLAFFLLFIIWFRRGRDPEGKGTIIARYAAPDQLTPQEVGTIFDEKVDNVDISSLIISLAVKGYLKIKELPGPKIFGFTTKKDYLLTQLSQDPASLESFERKFLDTVFDTGKEKKISELKNKFYKDLPAIREDLYQATVNKKYFPKNPQRTRHTYLGIGIAAAIIGVILGFTLFESGFSAAANAVIGLMVVLFGLFMPRKTAKGVSAKEHILGLKEYLSVAEADRLKFHNAPEKSPQIFEKLLPYAMVLGVEKDWAKQFEGIYQNPPSWYEGADLNNFSSFYFVNSLTGLQNTANAAFAASPSSGSGSGGSGFSSGGGFSGGGFGGGGGGSW